MTVSFNGITRTLSRSEYEILRKDAMQGRLDVGGARVGYIMNALELYFSQSTEVLQLRAEVSALHEELQRKTTQDTCPSTSSVCDTSGVRYL